MKHLLFLLLGIIPACGPALSTQVKTSASLEYKIDTGRTFRTFILDESKKQTLVAKNITYATEKSLIESGYTLSDEQSKPDVVVFISFTDEINSTYVPPRTIYMQQTTPGTTSYFYGTTNVGGNSYNSYGTIQSGGSTTYVPVTKGGHVEQYRFKSISLTIYDTLKESILWEGVAYDDNLRRNDFGEKAPCIAWGLISEYLGKTHSGQFIVPMKKCPFAKK